MAETKAKSCSACSKADCEAKQQRPGESPEMYADRVAIMERMCAIKRKIVVLSGKGGVGKSTVAANLALSLAASGKPVGLLDVDIHGPSIPRLLKLEGTSVVVKGNTMIPPRVDGMLKVMSIGFMLRGPDDAIIWRGPMKMGAIKQLLKDTEWGELDVLIVDCPPGTGDEPLSVIQLIGDADGAVIVTTPQELALLDVRKSINFCRKLELPVIGVIENMSGFTCPKCGEVVNIFKWGGAEKMAREMDVPFLGAVPLDPGVVRSGDAGRPLAEDEVADNTLAAFRSICQAIDTPEPIERKEQLMKVAIPVFEGKLCTHFGMARQFAFVGTDEDKKKVLSVELLNAPDHEPGILPKWIQSQGAELVIVGGMGRRAQELFAQAGVQCVVGAPEEPPEKLVKDYLDGSLKTGANVCDH